jgi:hypothetical protein
MEFKKGKFTYKGLEEIGMEIRNKSIPPEERNSFVQVVGSLLSNDINTQLEDGILNVSRKNLKPDIFRQRIMDLRQAMDNLKSPEEKRNLLTEWFELCGFGNVNPEFISSILDKFRLMNESQMVAMNAKVENDNAKVEKNNAVPISYPHSTTTPGKSAASGIACVNFVTPGTIPQRFIISLAN